jgi:hypothetical protein
LLRALLQPCRKRPCFPHGLSRRGHRPRSTTTVQHSSKDRKGRLPPSPPSGQTLPTAGVPQEIFMLMPAQSPASHLQSAIS